MTTPIDKYVEHKLAEEKARQQRLEERRKVKLEQAKREMEAEMRDNPLLGGGT